MVPHEAFYLFIYAVNGNHGYSTIPTPELADDAYPARVNYQRVYSY